MFLKKTKSMLFGEIQFKIIKIVSSFDFGSSRRNAVSGFKLQNGSFVKFLNTET